jgi:hypothetical protein
VATGQVDAVHLDSPLRQRQRDPPGADAELQRTALPRQASQQVHYGGDGLVREHLGLVVVVGRRDLLAEVAIRICHDRDSSARD